MLNIYEIIDELLTEELLAEAKGKNILEILRFSIEANLRCKIYYNGENTKKAGWRTIEPYAMGIFNLGSGKGEMVLRALQLTVTASDTPNGKNPKRHLSKLPNGWRMFKLSGIKDVKSGGGKFKPMKRPEYKIKDAHMSEIIVAVDKANKNSDNYVQNIKN